LQGVLGSCTLDAFQYCSSCVEDLSVAPTKLVPSYICFGISRAVDSVTTMSNLKWLASRHDSKRNSGSKGSRQIVTSSMSLSQESTYLHWVFVRLFSPKTKMTGVVRKLVILAAVDGLILQQSTQRNQRATPSLQIKYRTHEITPASLTSQAKDERSASFDAHGIVGSRPLKRS